MGRILTREEFLNRVPTKIKKDFEIGTFSGLKKRIILISKKSGLKFNPSAEKLTKGNYPSSRSAMCKEEYLNFKVNEILPEFKIITSVNNVKSKIRIIDSDNIEYNITIDSLLQGKKPNIDSAICKSTYFKIKASKIHNNKYSYDNSKYINARQYITIKCPVHGEFKQKTSAHLFGNGCPKCVIKPGGWNLTDWKKAGNTSNNFDSFKVYIIKCFDGDIPFYKVGRTFLTVQQRFNSFGNSSLPYNYKVIDIIEGTASHMFKLEKKIHKELKDYKYIPIKDFNGKTECFSNIDYYLQNRYKK